MLGVLAGLYNIFGADGLGVQIYLLAPVRMRDVIVAKNLASLVLVVAEVGLAWTLISLLKRTPIPLATQVSTAFWTIFVIMANLALGTLDRFRRRANFLPDRYAQQRGTPTNRTSGLLIILVLFGSLLLQIPVLLLCRYLHQPWLAAWIFGPLAAAAVAAYALLLRNADRLILAHRDVLAEELCKAARAPCRLQHPTNPAATCADNRGRRTRERLPHEDCAELSRRPRSAARKCGATRAERAQDQCLLRAPSCSR